MSDPDFVDIIPHLAELCAFEPSVTEVFGEDDESRCYPVRAPDAPDYPYAIFTKITGLPDYDLRGRTGVEPARVQIDVYGETLEEALVGKTRIADFLSDYSSPEGSGGCVVQSVECINDFDLTETSTERGGPRAFHRVLEFMVWHTEI